MVQIIKQTWQERFDMYMKLKKEELARMLAESDRTQNPEGCTDAIYLNKNMHQNIIKTDEADDTYCSSDIELNNNCATQTTHDDFGDLDEYKNYTYDEFVWDFSPTGKTFGYMD